MLLVGWDAADWKVIRPLMDAGKMPNIQRLVGNGATGQIATIHPPLSPMLWTSIATGKRPFKHGIHGFTEPVPDGSGVRPITNLSRKSKALWNIFSQKGLCSVVVGWWPSHPAEPIDGVMVSDQYHRATGALHENWALPPDTVHPPELAGVLAERRMHPDLITPAMVEPFIPLAKDLDQDKDKRLAAFLRTLAECMSIHSAAVWLMNNREWDFFAVYYEAIDHFCHSFMKYHPPRQSWIGERDFELYHNVVSMAYQFHDEMLGVLVKQAGEDATVILVSDHGFHPDHLRPASIPDIPAGPAIEHRDFGVFAISGPGIRKGEILHGASVLDVAPVILTLFGLPIGEDMDGKVLAQAFVERPAPAFVPSWEEIPGADGRHPPHTRLDPIAAHAAMEQLIALGYIERPDEDRETAIIKTIHELRYNLGEAYQDAGRQVEAREIFTELCEADPEEQRFAVRLFVSCQALGKHEYMRRIADDFERRRAMSPVTVYLKAQVLITKKRYAEALSALEHLTETSLIRPDLLLQTADLYRRLRREGDERRVYEKVLTIDPDNAGAYIGLCRMALRRRKFGRAAHSVLDALQRTYQDPVPHFLLGRALVGMQEYDRAAEAFRASISFNANFPEAHTRLADLLEKHLGDSEASREHRRLARSMTSRRASHPVHRSTPRATDEAREDGAAALTPFDLQHKAATAEMAPVRESLIVVTGLPRSGTSMLMQVVAAGGMEILSDALRPADEDNPRGYLEFAPVRNLLQDSKWLFEARGRAIKIVAPLLSALPPGLPCRVLLCERDLDEVLDSQERMLLRGNRLRSTTPERRRMLKDEYLRALSRVKAMLAKRPDTHLLVIEHSAAISDPLVAAGTINGFLGGNLDVQRMASTIDPGLYRNRARISDTLLGVPPGKARHGLGLSD